MHGRLGGFGEPDALVQAAQGRGRPPVELAGQAHERGDEQAADYGGVQDDRDAGADAEQLDEADLRGAEGEEGDGQQDGGGGDDAAGAGQAGGHGLDGVRAGVVRLLDAGQQEHLVVHGQPEGDAEDQQDHRDVGRAGGEAEQPGQVPVLEDPHQRAEHRGQRERVEGQGLDGQDDAASGQEQQYERGQGDRQQRPGQAAGDGGQGVDQRGGRTPHEHGAGPGGRDGADVADQLQGGGRLGVAGPGHPQVGGAVAGGHVLNGPGVRQIPQLLGVSGDGGLGHPAVEHDVDRCGYGRGVVGAQHASDLAAGGRGGQDRGAGGAKGDVQERNAEDQQDGDDRAADHHGPPHDRDSDATPERAVSGGGCGRAWFRTSRAAPAAGSGWPARQWRRRLYRRRRTSAWRTPGTAAVRP